MPKILTYHTPELLLLRWGGRAILEYSRLFQQIFSEFFCAFLHFIFWLIEDRAQYDARDLLIIDHLFEPHHRPQFWRLAYWYKSGFGDQFCAEIVSNHH